MISLHDCHSPVDSDLTTRHSALCFTVFGDCHSSESRVVVVGCLTSQQHATVSQGQICPHKFTCCHTEIEVADQTFRPTQSQFTDTGPTSPSTDPITPGAWHDSHRSANFEVTCMTRPRKKARREQDSNPGSSALEADALTTRPTRRSRVGT